MTAVALGSLAAFRLAALTDFGWVFGLALATLGVIWLLTTEWPTWPFGAGRSRSTRSG